MIARLICSLTTWSCVHFQPSLVSSPAAPTPTPTTAPPVPSTYHPRYPSASSLATPVDRPSVARTKSVDVLAQENERNERQEGSERSGRPPRGPQTKPASQPMTYRGVRSLKHKNDKSYKVQRSNSMHDLTEAGVGDAVPEADTRYRSRSRDPPPRRRRTVSDGIPQSILDQSSVTEGSINKPITFFESLINPPPPPPPAPPRVNPNAKSVYLRMASIPTSHGIETFMPYSTTTSRQDTVGRSSKASSSTARVVRLQKEVEHQEPQHPQQLHIMSSAQMSSDQISSAPPSANSSHLLPPPARRYPRVVSVLPRSPSQDPGPVQEVSAPAPPPRSPTSTLMLLNGRNKNETDERKVSFSVFR